MSRPAPLYARIRTTSSPDLGRRKKSKYSIKTQHVPESVDSLTPSLTLADHAARERYLSEPVSFHTFISEQNLETHTPTTSHYSSIASSNSPLEIIPYSQPLSIEIESSVVESSLMPATPMSPIVFQSSPSDEYIYLRPAFVDITPKERQARDTDAEIERIRFREDPATITHTHPFTSTETAILRTANDQYFEIYRRPFHLLEPGMRIICFGDMVGEWFTTTEMVKQKRYGYTSWKWINHEARLATIVRVDSTFIRPPTLTERVKAVAKKVQKFAKRTLEIE
ncbi:hypothetical protein DFH06DRAFT_1151240 [Mycena polygramma]|nr:hypothetical protein DFH06DRAFT_1151240 [Mycena polygramma]